MSRVRVFVAGALPVCAAVCVALAGCGTAGPRSPSVSSLPLVDGARVAVSERVCDKGANPYCALELVVLDDRFRTSTQLVEAEHRLLRSRGWTGVGADTGDEHAAQSPGDQVRVTYATAYGDLKGYAYGWVRRSRSVALALSRAMFAQRTAMSVLLEVGSG